MFLHVLRMVGHIFKGRFICARVHARAIRAAALAIRFAISLFFTLQPCLMLGLAYCGFAALARRALTYFAACVCILKQTPEQTTLEYIYSLVYGLYSSMVGTFER